MEGFSNNNPPAGNSSPRRGYSTIGPHPNPMGNRPRLAELDLTNSSATRSPSLAPSVSSQAGSTRSATVHAPGPNLATATPSVSQLTGTPPAGSLRALPQRVIQAYPNLAGMTREQAWQWELDQRNQWLASVRTWLVQTKERVMRERLATHNDFLQGLHDSMTPIIATLLDFDNQESIAAICMQEDRLRQSRPADLQIPVFQPPTASPTPTPSITGSSVAPSNTQAVAGSGAAGTGTDDLGKSSVATDDTETLLRLVRENLSFFQSIVSQGGTPTAGGPGIPTSVGHRESGPNTGGRVTTTHTPTGTTLSEAPQQPRDGNCGGDGDKTPRAQSLARTASIHASNTLPSQIGGSEDDLDRSQWLSNDSNSNQRAQAAHSNSTAASRNVNPPPSYDTPTGDTTTTPDNHNSSDSNTDTNDSKPYVGYYQAEPPYKLAPKRGTAAPSSSNPPTQPPRQPEGPGATDNTTTTDQSSPGGFGGSHQAQGPFRGQGGRRGRGGVNYYNRPPIGEAPIRMAHPDRPNEPLEFPRTRQQQQQAGGSRWSSTNARNNEDSTAFPSGSQASTSWQEPRVQGQGEAQGENQSQGWTQEQSEWEPYEPKDGTTFRNDW